MSFRTLALALALALLLLLASGCRAFRASAGFGPAFGAQVRASGIVHAGLFFEWAQEYGSSYGREAKEFFSANGIVVHYESEGGHYCFDLLPGLTGTDLDPGRVHPWAIEVGVGLLYVNAHLGFDPAALFVPPPADRRRPLAAPPGT